VFSQFGRHDHFDVLKGRPRDPMNESLQLFYPEHCGSIQTSVELLNNDSMLPCARQEVPITFTIEPLFFLRGRADCPALRHTISILIDARIAATAWRMHQRLQSKRTSVYTSRHARSSPIPEILLRPQGADDERRLWVAARGSVPQLCGWRARAGFVQAFSRRLTLFGTEQFGRPEWIGLPIGSDYG
jgi:hypothetical protein